MPLRCLLAEVETVIRHLQEMRRQAYGDGYKYDIWWKIEQELHMIIERYRLPH